MKIITAIASTTHTDLQGEKLSREVLLEFAKQINTSFVPNLIEHDPERQIGVLLCGRVGHLKDGEYALYVVSGIFESVEERLTYKNGHPNTLKEHYLGLLDAIDGKGVFQGRVPSGVSSMVAEGDTQGNLAQRLEKYLNTTSVWTDGRVYRVKHLIARINDLQVHVYPKDHSPAHFHVISTQRNINARFDLSTLELLSDDAGNITNRDVKKIQSFFKENVKYHDELKHEYLRLQG